MSDGQYFVSFWVHWSQCLCPQKGTDRRLGVYHNLCHHIVLPYELSGYDFNVVTDGVVSVGFDSVTRVL